MDNSWHHRAPPPPPPPPQATVCPICSMYHFPFCPPPFPQNYPIHYQYPSPPPQADQFYPRPLPPQPQPHPPPPRTPPPPVYDPFVDHQGGPALTPQRPFIDSQRPPWPPSSTFDRDPHGIMYRTDYCSNPGAKRMRFDDSGFSPSPAGHSSVEDERRLKLIRDHGLAMSGSFDEPSTNLGTSNSFHPGYGDVDEKPKFYSQKKNMQKYEDDRFGQQYNQSNRNAEYGQLSHSNVESCLHQNNTYECSGHSFNGMEPPRQNNEAMGYSWQGVSGRGAGYNDQSSGFGRESSHKYAIQHDMESKPNQYGLPYSNNQSGKNIGLHPDSRVFSCQPPLPASPPPPLPMEPPGQHLAEPVVTASTAVRSSYPRVPESSPLPSAYHPNRGHPHASTGFGSEELQTTRQAPYKAYFGSEVLPRHPPSPEKVKIVDASHILKHPHRANRPDHIVVILRGLPGSGKSYLAKLLRDLEVENGGNVPRIHSMDDYFMTEVEKVEESETPKTSGSIRGKRPVTKKVIEYCYEPEMEEAYRSSMLKAFKKTLDEGVFSFVIVDDRNLRVADFAQFWATAKRSGYEVYVLEATYKDPAGCAARNVHGFTLEDIQKMADLWEEAPSLYFKLDIKSLLHGDGLVDSGIQEVDMDMEDGDPVCGLSDSEERNAEKLVVPHEGDFVSDGTVKEDQRWDSEAYHPVEEVKDLGKSKWSNDLNDDNIHKNEAKGNLNALSGIKQSYNKEGKSVRWGDQACNSGFSIAAARTGNVASLVIGPGAGYNLKSNPLADEEKTIASHSTMKHNVFQERLRAEHESFRAVFDKRKQRISWLNGEED